MNKYELSVIEHFENLEPLTKDSYFPSLPKCDKEIWDKYVIPNLIRCGAIPKSQLKVGQWYYGDCRNSGIAMWNGKQFEYERTKFNFKFTDYINHFEDDDGYDLFIPIEEKWEA